MAWGTALLPWWRQMEGWNGWIRMNWWVPLSRRHWPNLSRIWRRMSKHTIEAHNGHVQQCVGHRTNPSMCCPWGFCWNACFIEKCPGHAGGQEARRFVVGNGLVPVWSALFIKSVVQMGKNKSWRPCIFKWRLHVSWRWCYCLSFPRISISFWAFLPAQLHDHVFCATIWPPQLLVLQFPMCIKYARSK